MRTYLILVITMVSCLGAGCMIPLDGDEAAPTGAVAWETGANPNLGSGGEGRGDFDDGTALPSGSADDDTALPSGSATGEPMLSTSPGSGVVGGGGGTVAPGTLTAGSFDDHLNPGAFDVFRTQSKGSAQDAPDLTQRALIHVDNDLGIPVNHARVIVREGATVFLDTMTASDGRALFIPALDGVSASGRYEVEVSADGVAKKATFAISDQPWAMTIPATSSLPDKLDLAFIVDATGSMGDELEFLKAETADISSHIAAAYPGVDVRFGLIVYRDEGDLYISRGYGFADLTAFKHFLDQQKADGGGDYPEAMDVALDEATKRLPWRQGNVARVAFLIADAPPHNDGMASTFAAMNTLRKMQVRLYPVAASGVGDLAEYVMRLGAFMTLGRYLFLTDDSGVGSSHAEPRVPCYGVEKLEALMIRMVASELSGALVLADPSQVLRTVGTPVAGVCQ